MTLSLTDMRQIVVSTALCLAGAMLVPFVPMVGFPLCALALAGLIYDGKGPAAAFVAGLAVTMAAFLRLSDAAVMSFGLVAVIVAVGRLRQHDALAVSVAMVPVFALAFAVGEHANAWLMNMTYREYVAEIAALMEPAMANLPAAVTGEALVDTVVRFAPAGYVVLAVLTVIPTTFAIGWAAVRIGADVRQLPRLEEVDFSPHVIWFPIAALLAMAAGRFLGQPEGLLTAIGLNLLLAARIILFIQGLAVLSSWLRTIGVGRVGRLFAYGAAFVADSTTWIVSLVGLVDFWVNLRKVDRGDSGDRIEPESVG